MKGKSRIAWFVFGITALAVLLALPLLFGNPNKPAPTDFRKSHREGYIWDGLSVAKPTPPHQVIQYTEW